MSRAIVHLDADAFFAAVEQAGDPKLRGKPIAVGGDYAEFRIMRRSMEIRSDSRSF
jgi:DNA polymerase-4